MVQFERLARGLREALALAAALLVAAALHIVWRWRARGGAAPAEPPMQRRRSDRPHRKPALRLVRSTTLRAPSRQEEPPQDASTSDTAAPSRGP
jgi:hypothetical protein